MHRLFFVLSVFLIFSTLHSAPAQAQDPRADFGSIAVRVVPPNADVFIDGERWVGPETDGRLVVQLPPGRHRVEIRAPGYRTFVSEVDVRAGETSPLNVSLVGSAPERRAPPSVRGPIRQVSETHEDNGFAIGPDFRVTELNHRTAELAGAYGGFVFGGHLLVGGGGYWQVNPGHDTQLGYGGAVVEWREWMDRPIGVAFHTLIGGGGARMDFAIPVDGPGRDFFMMNGFMMNGRDVRFGRTQGFFVVEPEAQVIARINRDLRLHVGVGYRATSVDRRFFGNNLDGVSGSISLQFGR